MRWDRLMALGLGALRLSPSEFWAMTPRELTAALGPFAPSAAIDAPARADLDALMARFPDDAARRDR